MKELEVHLGAVRSVSAVDSGPVSGCQLDIAHHLLVVSLAVDGPAEGQLVQRVAYSELLGLGHDFLQEGGVDVPLD